MQVSTAAISFFCYFTIFVHDPVTNDLNELCRPYSLIHTGLLMGIIATGKTSVVNISNKKNLFRR